MGNVSCTGLSFTIASGNLPGVPPSVHPINLKVSKLGDGSKVKVVSHLDTLCGRDSHLSYEDRRFLSSPAGCINLVHLSAAISLLTLAVHS